MNMRRKVAYALAIACAVGALTAPQQAAAEHTTFRQQILPLNCVFEVVNDGLGTINYITPGACGQVVQPPQPSNKPPANPSNTPQPTAPITNIPTPSDTPNIIIGAPTTSNKPPILLNQLSAATGNRGFKIIAKVGTKLSYYPRFGSDQQIEQTITITGISPQGVTFLEESDNQVVTIRPTQTIRLDYDDIGDPRLAVRLQGVPTNDSADLRIWLLNNTLPSGLVSPGPAAYWPLIIIGSGVFAVAIANLYIVRRHGGFKLPRWPF